MAPCPTRGWTLRKCTRSHSPLYFFPVWFFEQSSYSKIHIQLRMNEIIKYFLNADGCRKPQIRRKLECNHRWPLVLESVPTTGSNKMGVSPRPGATPSLSVPSWNPGYVRRSCKRAQRKQVFKTEHLQFFLHFHAFILALFLPAEEEQTFSHHS